MLRNTSHISNQAAATSDSLESSFCSGLIVSTNVIATLLYTDHVFNVLIVFNIFSAGSLTVSLITSIKYCRR